MTSIQRIKLPTVRGAIKLKKDITAQISDRNRSLLISGMVFLLTVVILALFLTSCMHNTIIFPVKHMGNICNYVTGGNFTVRVKVNNNDEIGLLGNTVNEMIEGLYERFELSKFVSSSTLQSIKSQDKGTKARLN